MRRILAGLLAVAAAVAELSLAGCGPSEPQPDWSKYAAPAARP